MPKQVLITSAIPLNNIQLETISRGLNLTAKDEVIAKVDPNIIAGIKVTVDNQAVDFTVKRQLADIIKES